VKILRYISGVCCGKSKELVMSQLSQSKRTLLEDEDEAEDDTMVIDNYDDSKIYFIIDRSFCGRILRLRREAMEMQYQLACLSTLGGAYHLCNKPETALALAIRQETLGRRLGSSSIVLRSKVFQAVNLSLLGHSKESRLLFKKCHSVVKREGWADLERFVLASKHWLKMELARRLREEGIPDRVVEILEENCAPHRGDHQGKPKSSGVAVDIGHSNSGY
jgi:hypothetical protein